MHERAWSEVLKVKYSKDERIFEREEVHSHGRLLHLPFLGDILHVTRVIISVHATSTASRHPSWACRRSCSSWRWPQQALQGRDLPKKLHPTTGGGGLPMSCDELPRNPGSCIGAQLAEWRRPSLSCACSPPVTLVAVRVIISAVQLLLSSNFLKVDSYHSAIRLLMVHVLFSHGKVSSDS